MTPVLPLHRVPVSREAPAMITCFGVILYTCRAPKVRVYTPAYINFGVLAATSAGHHDGDASAAVWHTA